MMNHSLRLARILLSTLILMILIFVGCQRTAQTPAVDNSDVQIGLIPMPAEETLVVVLTDANDAPITDATVAVEGNMNHAGMIPVLVDPIADDADGSADGHYHLPFTYTMFGDWILSVTVTRADGSSLRRDLDVRNSANGVEGDSVMPMDSHEAAHDTALHVQNAVARPAPMAGGTGAVYLHIHNAGESAVRLLGAESSAAAAVEIHTTQNDNGVMRMRQLTDGVEIKPDEMVEFAPNGMHLMLVDLAAPLAEGDMFTMTLYFEGADDITLDVTVGSMDDMSTEGEMKHSR